MSLDVHLIAVVPTAVFDYNITHNLGRMAAAAGIYKHLWRPDECHDVEKAGDLIEPLADGLYRLRQLPDHFSKYDSPNGWGTYKHLVEFVEKYLAACRKHPDAKIETWR